VLPSPGHATCSRAVTHTENISFKQLALECNVPQTTLQDLVHGGVNCKKAHAHQHKLPPSAEKILEDWCKQSDNWELPPHMNQLNAIALVLAEL
jgi:hypothetical protein